MSKKLNRIYPYIIFFSVSIILIGFQLMGHATLISGDTMFHFNRFYDIKQQIQTGNFSLFQTNYAFNESGRVINAVYGPLFAYMNGLLVLITNSWFEYQILTDLIIMMLASIGMYLFLEKIKVNRVVSILLSIVFICIGLVPTWLDNSSFNAWGAALAPYVFNIGVQMIINHKKPINWISLMVIMSIVAQVHVLSTVILSIALIPFFIIGLMNASSPKRMSWDLFKAILGTILLTSNVWGALVVLYKNNSISAPGGFNLAQAAVKPSRFQSIRGYFGIPLLIITLIQVILLIFKGRKNKLNLVVTTEGLIFLFISSKFFPWTSIEGLLPNLRRILQFPSRLLIVAYPLLLAGLGISLTNLILIKKSQTKIIYLLLILLLLSVFLPLIKRNYLLTKRFNNPNYVIVNDASMYNSVVMNRRKIQNASKDKNKELLLRLFTQQQPDYLPLYKNTEHMTADSYYVKYIIDRQQKFHHSVEKNGVMKLSWKSIKSGKINLPIIIYRESKLIVNSKHIKDLNLSYIGTPTINEKKGNNIAYIYFVVPKVMYVFLILSIIGWTIVCCYYLKAWLN